MLGTVAVMSEYVVSVADRAHIGTHVAADGVAALLMRQRTAETNSRQTTFVHV